MKKSDMNHLRRLLGWIRCDIGQAPAELQQTMIDVAAGLGHPEISEEAKARMVETYRRAEAVPLYVRAAVKALEKVLASAGREGGAGKASAAAGPRANTGFDPGVDAGRELLGRGAPGQDGAVLASRGHRTRDAEYAAGLRAALILARDSHGVALMTDPPQDAWKARRVDEVIRAALAGPTQEGETC